MATCVMALSNAEIIDLLNSATTDLWWISEADAPFEVLLWEDLTTAKLTEKKLLKWLAFEADITIGIQTIDEFFQAAIEPQDWHGEEEQATITRYKNLISLLKENLSDLQVYRLGECEITIYLVGKTPNGQWLALKTEAIET
jgi:hypothetical protein